MQIKSIVFTKSVKLCNQSDKPILDKYDVNNLKKHFIKKTTRVVARKRGAATISKLLSYISYT